MEYNVNINDRTMKQKYLREQVVENGWNSEKFAEYLETIRTDGEFSRHQHRQLGLR